MQSVWDWKSGEFHVQRKFCLRLKEQHLRQVGLAFSLGQNTKKPHELKCGVGYSIKKKKKAVIFLNPYAVISPFPQNSDRVQTSHLLTAKQKWQ